MAITSTLFISVAGAVAAYMALDALCKAIDDISPPPRAFYPPATTAPPAAHEPSTDEVEEVAAVVHEEVAHEEVAHEEVAHEEDAHEEDAHEDVVLTTDPIAAQPKLQMQMQMQSVSTDTSDLDDFVSVLPSASEEEAAFVVGEDMVVANTIVLAATESPVLLETLDEAPVPSPSAATANVITNATATATMSEEATAEKALASPVPVIPRAVGEFSPLTKQYASAASAWPGLSVSQRKMAAMILFRLDQCNNSQPFAALRDPLDVVGVVCRSVPRLGVLRACNVVYNHWLPLYQDLASNGDPATFNGYQRNYQQLLSTWSSDPVPPSA